MRKKSVSIKKASAKRTTHHKVTRDKEQILLLPFSFRRIILVSTCLLLFVVIAVTHKNQVTQSVAGITIARGLFSQTTVTLPKIDGAVAYNIYYKQTSDSKYTNAVRRVPTTVSTFLLSYLKKGEAYDYKISALNSSGKEFWWSETKPLINLRSM